MAAGKKGLLGSREEGIQSGNLGNESKGNKSGANKYIGYGIGV